MSKIQHFRELVETVRYTVENSAALNEGRETIDELAEYSGEDGPKGYAFAAAALAQDYEKAASIIDADPEQVENDLAPRVDRLYETAQHEVDGAVGPGATDDILGPLRDAKNSNDPEAYMEAVNEVKETVTQYAQARAAEYWMERQMKQAQQEMEDMFSGEGTGELDGLFDAFEEGLDNTEFDDDLDMLGLDTEGEDVYDTPTVSQFIADDEVFDDYMAVREVVDSIEDPTGFAEAVEEEDFDTAVEHTAYDEAENLQDAFEAAEAARTTVLEKGLERLRPEDVSELQEKLDRLYGER